MTPTTDTSSATLANPRDPVVDRLASTAHAAIDQAAAKAAPMIDKMSQTVHSMSRAQGDWTQTAREQVRERPLSALAAGFVVGWLLARLSR
ncbi:MAG: hypothetical protein V4739_04245 [Pseudomonadota bacterium]